MGSIVDSTITVAEAVPAQKRTGDYLPGSSAGGMGEMTMYPKSLKVNSTVVMLMIYDQAVIIMYEILVVKLGCNSKDQNQQKVSIINKKSMKDEYLLIPKFVEGKAKISMIPYKYECIMKSGQ